MDLIQAFAATAQVNFINETEIKLVYVW